MVEHAKSTTQTINKPFLQHIPEIKPVALIFLETRKQKYHILPIREQESDRKKEITDAYLLSKREHEVLQLVTRGLSNLEIAWKLEISDNTVKIHLRHIFDKLKVQSRTAAAVYAICQGWVSII
jgi:DNA-binding NarL/FixJ family response regulator